jgi:hypothetical protein
MFQFYYAIQNFRSLVMRNHYEYEVYHFEKTIKIPSDKDKNIIMYCISLILSMQMFFILLKNYKIMKLIVSLTAAILFISCGHSPLVSQFEGSDSVAVKFIELGTGAVIKEVATSQTYAIKDLLRFADSEETGQLKCGYDGNIVFYKKGTVAGNLAFNYKTDGCHHFLFMANGRLTTTKMSNEAADFLKDLSFKAINGQP